MTWENKSIIYYTRGSALIITNNDKRGNTTQLIYCPGNQANLCFKITSDGVYKQTCCKLQGIQADMLQVTRYTSRHAASDKLKYEINKLEIFTQ